MSRRVLIVFVVSVFLVASVGCRSRRSVPPRSAPPTTAAAEVPVPAPGSAGDFSLQPSDPEIRTADISAVNRMAREQGLIQDAFFAFDESTLDADAQEALRRSATWLRAHPGYRLRVEGHCDERGTEQYNLALGDRRASTAETYLIALGVLPNRISTVSYGESRPFEEGANEAAWAQNRRAHLVLMR
jgi:peptidoglycan-associated lipoprotein